MADINYLSYANDEDLNETLGDLIPDGNHYSDTLKLSNCHRVRITAGKIVGGREDCVDINRGSHITVEAEEYHPRGKFVFTVKGGADKVWLNGKLMGHGSEVDVDLGNWSDQAMDRTKVVLLNLTTHDGSPIRVRVLHGWKPVIVNPAQRYEIDVRAKGVFGTIMGFLKKLKFA